MDALAGVEWDMRWGVGKSGTRRRCGTMHAAARPAVEPLCRRAFLKSWAGDAGLLYVDSTYSTGMLADFRLWDQPPPGVWEETPTALIWGDPHIKVRLA